MVTLENLWRGLLLEVRLKTQKEDGVNWILTLQIMGGKLVYEWELKPEHHGIYPIKGKVLKR